MTRGASLITALWRVSALTRQSAGILNLCFRHRFEQYTPDGGEPYAATSRRISGALEQLVQSSYTNVLVVAHGGCLNVALRDLLRAPVLTSFAFGDTSFAEVTVARRSDQVGLLSLNRKPHLGEE